MMLKKDTVSLGGWTILQDEQKNIGLVSKGSLHFQQFNGTLHVLHLLIVVTLLKLQANCLCFPMALRDLLLQVSFTKPTTEQFAVHITAFKTAGSLVTSRLVSDSVRNEPTVRKMLNDTIWEFQKRPYLNLFCN